MDRRKGNLPVLFLDSKMAIEFLSPFGRRVMVKTKDLSEFSASAPEFKLPPILHCRQNFERGDDTLRAVMDGING